MKTITILPPKCQATHAVCFQTQKRRHIKIPERHKITERNLSGKSSQLIYYRVYVSINWLIYILNSSKTSCIMIRHKF